MVINQGAIDRGLFRSITYKSYRDEEKRHNSVMVSEFDVPTKKTCVGMRRASYANLDSDGIVKVHARIKGGDAIVGKTTPVSLVTDSLAAKRQNVMSKKDDSTFMKINEKGVVDSVILSTNHEGLRFAKIRVRDVRIPEIGDKFASLIAQKGTCGFICRQEDMPFTRDGITPDIIINPLCIPSRMTVGQLIECISGKVAVLSGKTSDATPFDHMEPVQRIAHELHQCGYQQYGCEKMYSGHTGKPLEAQIFIGPVYYQRLKHMVHDKQFARSHGPVTALTRQPLEGRNRQGGLRLGENHIHFPSGRTSITRAAPPVA